MSTRFYDTDLTDAAWAWVAPVLLLLLKDAPFPSSSTKFGLALFMFLGRYT